MDARRHGQWTNSQICTCPAMIYWRCYRVYLQEIPSVSDDNALRAVPRVNLASIGAFLLSRRPPGQLLAHDCVKLRIQCKHCGRGFYITVEHGTSGVRLSHAYYQRESQNRQEQAVDMSYASVIAVFQLFKDKPYDLFNYNCQDFAKEFYREIIQRNAESDLSCVIKGILAFLPQGNAVQQQ